MSEGGHIEEVLDQVRWARLSEPQKHDVPVLQQERAGICESLLGAANRSRHSIAADINVVLGGEIKISPKSFQLFKFVYLKKKAEC